MIIESLSLTQTITSLESVLKIEYSNEAKVDEIIKDAIKRLENANGITIDKDIYSLQAENQLATNVLDRFVLDVTECLKQLSLYICLQTFNHSVGFTLADVNYLGTARAKLLAGLKYLLDKNFYPRRADIINMIAGTLDSVPLNKIKRLFVALLLLEKLGITEGVAIVAQLLYMGGIIA